MNRPPELFAISALRGLAALGVVFFHVRVDLWVGWQALRAGVVKASAFDHLVSWLSAPLPFLGSGVMLFFIISGFCIALPYAGDRGRPMRWRQYVVRRLLRIYPPYLATLVLCFLVERSTPGMSGSPTGTFFATSLMVQNYTTGQVVSNPSFWSLPVEVELYLLFPLVLVILQRWGTISVLLNTGLVSLAALLGYFWGMHWVDGNAAKFWVLWASGAVLAEWYQRGRLRPPSFAVLSGGLIITGLTMAGELRGVPGALLHFGYGVGFFILVWWAVAREAVWAALPPFVSKPLLLLGTISYSLYLVHFPFFRWCGSLWVREFGQKPVNLLIPLAFGSAAVGVGWCFYRLVEAPSHRWAKSVFGSSARDQAPALSK